MKISSIYNAKFSQISGSCACLGFSAAAFMALGPYFLWNEPPTFYRTLAFFTLLCTVSYLPYQRTLSARSCFLFLSLAVAVVTNQFYSEGVSLTFSTATILCFAFVILDAEKQEKTFEYFYSIYAIMLTPSLVVFFFTAAGFGIDWSYLEPQSVEKLQAGVWYREYFGAVVSNRTIFILNEGYFFRLHGVFDEPGKVGTLAALFLTAKDFNLRTLKAKIVLVSGILSFSLAFYLLIFLFLMLKMPRRLAAFSTILFASLIFLPEEIRNNEAISKYVFYRPLTAVYDFASINNRTDECFDSAFEDFKSTKDFWLGLGNGSHTELGCDVASYKAVLFNQGVVSFVAFASFYGVSVIVHCQRLRGLLSAAPFLLVAVASQYQRPALDSLWFFIIFVGYLSSFCSKSRL